jgi:hypothetical protein
MTFAHPSSGQLSANTKRTGRPAALRTHVGSVSASIGADRYRTVTTVSTSLTSPSSAPAGTAATAPG